jgi:tripartite-type tricarboxylate transporter receptor subunit TctC
MQERLNQTIVVENRSGANGGIAVNAMTSAPADGTTFVVHRRRDHVDQSSALLQASV